MVYNVFEVTSILAHVLSDMNEIYLAATFFLKKVAASDALKDLSLKGSVLVVIKPVRGDPPLTGLTLTEISW